MAAYASLVTLARHIDPIHGDLNHIYLDMDLKPLYEKVVQLQTIIENCPGETLSQEFQARIRDFGYRANRVIDNHYLEVLRWKRGEGCVSLPKFQPLTDEAASLILEAPNLGGDVATTADLIMQMKELSLVSSSSSAQAPVPATQKVRLYSDVTKLKDKLYAGSSQREVIPIVGMGGSGKTTVASALFEDSRSERRFDRRAWITVPQNYDKCTLLSQILQCLKESAPETYGDIGEKVYQTLKGRRYLVVIDDVWSEKLWDDINIFLPNDGNGSRILLTTRLENVANYVVPSSDDYDESYIHKAKLMNFDMSWSLLKDTVFGRDGNCPNELEKIGKSIAQECGGLPLTIVVVAGVLSSTNNKRNLWEKVAADVKIAIKKSSSRVAKILSWSYINLPHHLKPCFLYLASFPEDYEIEVTKLMNFWICEGFLKLENSQKHDEEKVAYDYLEDLAKKNLVLVSQTDNFNKIRYIRLHDMIRDLCVEIAERENFMSQVKSDCESSSEEIKDPIRFSVCSMDSMFDLEKIHDDAHVRTILIFLRFEISRRRVFRTSFHLLRVLNAEKITFVEFPPQVMQLFCLRYLAICVEPENGDLIVPSSLKNLQSLLVLTLRSWRDIIYPLEIWEMPKLRHLISCSSRVELPDPPIGTSSLLSSPSLENLQSLTSVANFKLTEHVLQMIPNIKMLGIRQFDINPEEACLLKLFRLMNLETLSICGYFSRRNIQLPHSLKELSLYSGEFLWSDLGTVAGSLPNLEVITLEVCNFHEEEIWEVKEGEFSKLRVLDIFSFQLVTWKYDGEIGGFFPNLERLKLRDFEKLTEFPRCIGDIDTLKQISIKSGNELLVHWAREVKQEQESNGNEFLQVIIN